MEIIRCRSNVAHWNIVSNLPSDCMPLQIENNKVHLIQSLHILRVYFLADVTEWQSNQPSEAFCFANRMLCKQPASSNFAFKAFRWLAVHSVIKVSFNVLPSKGFLHSKVFLTCQACLNILESFLQLLIARLLTNALLVSCFSILKSPEELESCSFSRVTLRRDKKGNADIRQMRVPVKLDSAINSIHFIICLGGSCECEL